MAQVWYLQQKPQPPYGQFQGKPKQVCSCRCWFHRHQVGRSITPPTVERTVVKNGAGVVVSSRNCNRRTASSKGNRNRCVLVGVGSTVTKLAVVIIPPTVERTVVKNGAGVVFSSSECSIGENRPFLMSRFIQ